MSGFGAAALTLTLAAATMTAAQTTPSPELSLGVFGGGGAVSESDTYGLQSVLGLPGTEPSEGAGKSLTPGGVTEAARLTDACPQDAGTLDHQGCPAGVAATTALRVTDHRPGAPACGTGRPNCSIPQEGARVKVFDRDELEGLTITTREGDSVTLTRNPDSRLYDDIFESRTAFEAARAAEFGCIADSSGTCVAGVRRPGDLLLLVHFEDVSAERTIYAGRSLTATDFVDSDGDGARDRATETLQVVKVIDRRGAASYKGGRNTAIVVV